LNWCVFSTNQAWNFIPSKLFTDENTFSSGKDNMVVRPPAQDKRGMKKAKVLYAARQLLVGFSITAGTQAVGAILFIN
jgi:hypothetical protein